MEKKIVLVAGGTGGIGSGLILGIASSDYRICFTYNNSIEKAKSLVADLGEDKVESYKCDVTNRVDVTETVKAIQNKYEKIDVLINVFGLTSDKMLPFMKDEDWDSVMDTNLGGVFNFTRAAITEMLKRRAGSIINFSSVSGIVGIPGQTNYSASKAAIIGFSKALAKEASPRGVRVNVIAPGFIKTTMTSKLSEDYVSEVKKKILMGRMGEVGELVGITRYLMSEESSYVTGQVFIIDGGAAL
jgi:3-oxoacyl-[acyl-carrier protein] reductase